MRRVLSLGVIVLIAVVTLAMGDGLPPGVKNTQKPGDKPPTPAEAARMFRAPPGFNVTLFAGEPDVSQPIALTFDERGRVWVGECYSYPEWKSKGIDRILIFSDTNGDGKYDQRKVFLDKLTNLTSVAVGHGGVWVLSAPRLLFYPDRNHDDIPDGKPITILDGWTLKARHNIVNGLVWGPDGWLYGCHGITAESRVGKPGTPENERTRMRCGIWRYHPARKVFEVVCHGTTNPWGLDFDDHGEAFFTNCVIGHLWHVIPGARYQRMYGQDYNPHACQLIASTSDHLHWGGGHWTSSRGGKGTHSEAGGGHAHAGAMIYLGDNWPRKYRNSIFMCNLHGNRLNRDLLQREGAGYVGRHAPDFLTSTNPWFRGVAVRYGAGGAAYITDWSDLGECHDNDGVHRTSGRIYRVAHGKTSVPANLNLARRSDADLVKLQLHRNDWYVRRARLELAERAVAGKPMGKVHTALKEMFASNSDDTRQLRALWALYVTGGTDEAWLGKQLDHGSEHVRAWVIRLLCDQGAPSSSIREKFAQQARSDRSGLVRLYLASALQRLPLGDRWGIARTLAQHAEDANDRCLPLMLWYGIEPAVVSNRTSAAQLAVTSKIPLLRQFLARRLTEDSDRAGLRALLSILKSPATPAVRLDLLAGLQTGLRGSKAMKMPAEWKQAYEQLMKSPRAEIQLRTQAIALVFNDSRASKALRSALEDVTVPAARRTAALRALVDHRTTDLVPVLFKLLDDKKLRGSALRALAAYEDDNIPTTILKRYSGLTPAEKEDAIATLTSRPKYALALLDAIARKRVPRGDVSVFAARQMKALRNKQVSQQLEKVWGQIRQSSKQRKKLIAQFQKRLSAEVLRQANPARGRVVFQKSCSQCHTLFGEGGKIGPDLTGSNRNNLYYVLENLIDPSAVVGGDYQLVNFYTNRGRLVSGIVVEETERAVTVQTANERVVLAKKDIDARKQSRTSMMPEGMIDKMSFDELRDLVRYLSSSKQVPLPAGAASSDAGGR